MKGCLDDKLNMLVDFYELTMSNGYLDSGIGEKIAYFDMFFRKNPDNGGFAIFSGLESVINYLENLKFSSQDIKFLRQKNLFNDKFIDYLTNFNFSCDVWAVPEGTPIFPNEPIVTVRGPIIQAQIIETMLLLNINHQSLIATKANRIVRAAKGRSVMEFGARRAQGHSGALLGARASYIGGCSSTSCTLAEIEYGIACVGTMAHSWVQCFNSELEAFQQYARIYPGECVLLIDTYDTLKSGIKNAIKVFKEEIIPKGFRPKGVRIDSGDISYLSIIVRNILDKEGFCDCKIFASNALDEYVIRDMIMQGAKVDVFGVGENLITSSSNPVFGGVYKLCALEENGEIIPKIKISENVSKITTPCFKELWRLYDKESGKSMADVITLYNETIDDTKPYEIFDPQYTWKRKTIKNFVAKKIKKQIFKYGKKCYKSPDIKDIRDYCKSQVGMLWDEVKRFENPHNYYVDLSEKLWIEKRKAFSKNHI